MDWATPEPEQVSEPPADKPRRRSRARTPPSQEVVASVEVTGEPDVLDALLADEDAQDSRELDEPVVRVASGAGRVEASYEVELVGMGKADTSVGQTILALARALDQPMGQMAWPAASKEMARLMDTLRPQAQREADPLTQLRAKQIARLRAALTAEEADDAG